jgi:RNA polymerase sigma-70 factor, ECF subfamily
VHASILRVVAVRDAAGDAAPARMTIEALFSAHVGFVWRSLRHFGVGEADIEDQIQEVFLIAHRRHAEWDGQHPRAWLYAISRRCASAYRRRGHRRYERPSETLPEPRATQDPSIHVEVDLLRRLLNGLDEEKQSVFVLFEIEEMSMREVAEAVQCTVTAAYARLYAARREIARAIQEAK